jgi:hypothetical protein
MGKLSQKCGRKNRHRPPICFNMGKIYPTLRGNPVLSPVSFATGIAFVLPPHTSGNPGIRTNLNSSWTLIAVGSTPDRGISGGRNREIPGPRNPSCVCHAACPTIRGLTGGVCGVAATPGNRRSPFRDDGSLSAGSAFKANRKQRRTR